jgi:hypothetical protein
MWYLITPTPTLPHQREGEIFGEGGYFIPLCSRMRRIILDREKL